MCELSATSRWIPWSKMQIINPEEEKKNTFARQRGGVAEESPEEKVEKIKKKKNKKKRQSIWLYTYILVSFSLDSSHEIF